MKSTNTASTETTTDNHSSRSVPGSTIEPTPPVEDRTTRPAASPHIRRTARDFANPVDYRHRYESLGRYADFLALRYDANRTRHAYYRHLRLIQEYFDRDPGELTESQLREYFLFVKLKKHWKPKTIRQALAATRMFYVGLLARGDWTLFSQIRAKDHDALPAVLTRQQVHDLLRHIRLRRYRTPLKLIYCCGLRLSECLGLTIHSTSHRHRGVAAISAGVPENQTRAFPAAAPRHLGDHSLPHRGVGRAAL